MQNHEKWRYTGDIEEIYWRYRAREMMKIPKNMKNLKNL